MTSQNQPTDIKVRCYLFSIRTIKLLNLFPEKRLYWVIGDQLLRSATSIGANIVEGKSASSRKDFIKYYEIALKSANETKDWIGLVRDATDIDKTETKKLLSEAEEIAKILAASIISLKSKKF
jgi:four helix bundle protein